LMEADVAFGQPDRVQVERAEKLRWVQISSAGFTRFDDPEFRAHAAGRDLIVTNSSSVFDEPCAQHVLAFILAQARRLPASLDAQRGERSWESLPQRARCRLLRNQMILLLGYGSIAERLTELLAPFEVRVVGLRRKPTGLEKVKIITEEELSGALAEADHVVNILPDSSSTSGFLDAAKFAAMKPEAIFYNIGRGTTIDQGAIQSALECGHLSAAYLDVTDPEPLPPDHPLWTAPNCFITPHIGGGHQEEHLDLVRHFARNFERFHACSPLLDRIF